MKIWMNKNNYKPATKIVYTIEAIKAKIGTIVINKLEQPEMLKRFGKDWFEPDEVTEELLAAAKRGDIYIVSEEQPYVLRGTVGELWTISEEKLFKKYDIVDDETTTNLSKVRTKPDSSKCLACFVPEDILGTINTAWGTTLQINDPRVEHGKGDFVIAQLNNDGTPNLDDIYVVNGKIFATTYDTTRWEDCIE